MAILRKRLKETKQDGDLVFSEEPAPEAQTGTLHEREKEN